ncbi:hypothetical protein M7I_2174 [Glarea lozoyensis 74030]|uniref:Maintenance of telomere capping protein 4 n=1 Tax=Glarea lozoyensis (strain ATCC 74030 / MF5533) TaxID=1104152 RepID=H0EI28_GLAL7|nr:hypothetical protein M7I_2174 [Glarea lozoyensis 74030]
MRLRTGRAINGEEQGFGDLAKVSSWVDQVLTEASSAEYQAADCLPMPPFSKAAKEAASPHTSPSSNHGKGHSSAPKVDLKRPISKQGNGNSSQFNFNSRIKDQASGLDLYVDTKMPEFMQIKAESDKHSDGAVSKAKDKLRQVRHAAGLPHAGLIQTLLTAVNCVAREENAVNTGSVRRSKLEESGIKGLFKGRNPVSRVGDFVWKTAKEQIPGLSSGYSSDDSELDEPSPPSVRPKKDSNASSVGAADDNAATDLPKERATYTRDLPTFTSPFEGRGRTIRNKNTESTSSSDPLGRESKKAIARSTGLEPPPRIDIQSASPTSSPDPNGSNRRKRDSSVSDTDISRRQSLASGSRLNEILGSPGHRRNALPMTGLANLEVTNDRTSIDSQRQWSISDRAPSVHRGPMSKREIARVRALLLSSGIKAKEITRRAAEPQDLNTTTDPHYAGISKFAHAPISPVPKSQQHNLAAHILETDIHNSSEMWQASTDHFIGTSIQKLFDDINALRSKVNEGITNMARTAADEADEVSKDLVTSQTLAVKAITDKMDTMMRRRRRRFRWLRQGVWVVVEWALVGVMWADSLDSRLDETERA